MRPHPDGRHLASADGKLLFVLGYNYEGPSDRAWRMWQEYDEGLIAADLGRARGGGANTVRIFVQQPLPAEIMAGNFAKLDAVIAAAARHGLYVILTLYDYGERWLVNVAEVGRRIAEHYRGNPTIMAYDLRNEPQYLTLAAQGYPPGTVVPLQETGLVPIYGERISMEAVPAYRASGDGRVLPGDWIDAQVYAYANNLAYFREFLAASDRWVIEGSGRTSVDFARAPEAQAWQPLLGALNGTLDAWIRVQRDALRSADPEHMLTIGWSNALLASLPANEQLELISLHRFPAPSTASVGQTLNLAAALRRVFPQRPLLFEELGYSTAEIDAEGAATLEAATALRAYSEGYAGFLKWMLTDLPPVGNPREDNFGALRVDGSAKPIYQIFGALQSYLSSSAAPPGGSVHLTSGPSFVWSTSDAIYLSGQEVAYDGLGFKLPTRGHVLLRKRGAIYLLSTQPGEVGLNLRTLMAAWSGGKPLVEQRQGSGWASVASAIAGDELRFAVQPDLPYRVSLPQHTDGASSKRGCRYFVETKHNLCGAFLRYWESNGGLAIFGYPLSEEFSERNRQDGNVYTVQYFERNRFEYHPELAGTRYEVLLGLLGNDLTAARRAEAPFVRRESHPGGDRDFHPETGHSLGGAFRAYWYANGGLAIFGYPLSEEFQEYNPADGKIYTVQYFERNRFEYHPELAGTRYEVLLGLLGNQTVDGSGWR